MNRQQRQGVASETVAILDAGAYTLPGGDVISIREDLHASCEGTRLYLPEEYQSLVDKISPTSAQQSTSVVVSNRTTLEAAQSILTAFNAVVALNFASAKNPGGGFLSGSQAQEESLARASGLYSTLNTQSEYYDFHRQQSTCLYSDRVIYSPAVPVFRNDEGHLLATPWKCSFITAAAVNAGAVRRNEPERVNEIIPAMQRRAEMVLAIAALQGYQALVLGAWGCGVFANEPSAVARIFAAVLAAHRFAGRFAYVEFAVYDTSPEQTTYRAFRDELTA